MAFCFGAATAPFWGERPAQAAIDYAIDVTFIEPETTGSLSGSFTLAGGSDCLAYEAGTCGWTDSGRGYFFQDLTNVDVEWSYIDNGEQTRIATSALYGYTTTDGVYFLQFSEVNDEFLNAFMTTTLPGPGGSIPLVESIGDYESAICSLALPPPAATECPGKGSNTIFLTFGDSNVSAVPAPLGPVLLLPAILLTRLRKRYGSLPADGQSSIQPVAQHPVPAFAVGNRGQ